MSMYPKVLCRSLLIVMLLAQFLGGWSQARAQLIDQPTDSLLGTSPESPDEDAFQLTLVLEPISKTRAIAWLNFSSPKDWHTYGPFQNDTGSLPIVNWNLPDGVSAQTQAENWLWPIPERYTAPGDILDYVYHGDVSVGVSLTGPVNWWNTAKITLDAEWLVCDAQLCVPKFADVLEHTLATESWRPAGEFIGQDRSAKHQAEQLLKANAPSTGSPHFELAWDENQLVARSRDGRAISFYPAQSGLTLLADVQTGTSSTGTLRLGFEHTETGRVRGILSETTTPGNRKTDAPARPEPVAIYIDIPMPKNPR